MDELPENAAVLCNIGDYVSMKLAGRSAPVSDVTISASLGILNNETRNINQKLYNIDKINPEIFPKIIATSEILGSFKSIPVVQTLGDNQASFIGSVINKDQTLLLNYGTGGQLSFYSENLLDLEHFETRPFPGQGYLYAGSSLSGGNSYKILADFFSQCLKLFGCSTEINVMKIMDQLELDLSVEEIKCSPLFFGERTSKEAMASFRDITAENFSPGNILKALVQGMAWELHRFYRVLPEDVKQKLSLLTGAGNGIRKNRHLMQMVEILYNKPLYILQSVEESCLGAVINAGTGVQIFKSHSDGSQSIVEYSKALN